MNSLQTASASKNNNARYSTLIKHYMQPPQGLAARWILAGCTVRCVLLFLMHLLHADCSFSYFLDA